MKTKRTITLTVAALGFSLLAGASTYTATKTYTYRGNANTLFAPGFAPGQERDSKIKTFTGTIAKKGDQFILTDDSSKSSYSLDDQQTAEKFAGKKVRVKGILDAVNNTIRIETIEIAAA
ncbi:MAG TPA: DUF5818 domain-containing protein [Candidatus Acidoferrales bacterium]|jgi:hypothetical protein